MSEDTKALKELLEAKLDVIAGTTSKLVDVIFGNGKDGLIERTTRIEDATDQLKLGTKEAALAAKEAALEAKITRDESGAYRITVTKSLGEIKDLVVEHNRDKTLHTAQGIFLKRDVIFYIIAISLVIHSLIPENLNIWELIRKIFGI